MAGKKKKVSKKKASRRTQSMSGTDTSVMDELGELADGWEDTEERVFEDVPDGRYQVRIDKATVNKSQSSGRLQVSWDLMVVSGKHKNRHVFEHAGLETDQNRSFFRGTLTKLGLEWPDNPKDLPGYLDDNAVGMFAQVTVRTKQEFQNVYFDKALDPDDVDLDGVAGPADGFDPGELDPDPDPDPEPEARDFATDGDVGDRVYVDEHGADFPGEVTDYDADAETADVKFDDGDTGTFPYDEIHFVDDAGTDPEPDPEPEEPRTPQKGDRCRVKIDGEYYEGDVARANQRDKVAHVKFDDGDEDDHPFDDVELLTGAKVESGSGTGSDATFTIDDMTAAQCKKAKALGTKHEFDVEDYGDDNLHLLLVDIAEFLNVDGTYDNPTDIIRAIEAAG